MSSPLVSHDEVGKKVIDHTVVMEHRVVVEPL